MASPMPPRFGTEEYRWWADGAAAEAASRNEGLNEGARELRDMIESVARMDPSQNLVELILTLAKIYCPDRLRRRYR